MPFGSSLHRGDFRERELAGDEAEDGDHLAVAPRAALGGLDRGAGGLDWPVAQAVLRPGNDAAGVGSERRDEGLDRLES